METEEAMTTVAMYPIVLSYQENMGANDLELTHQRRPLSNESTIPFDCVIYNTNDGMTSGAHVECVWSSQDAINIGNSLRLDALGLEMIYLNTTGSSLTRKRITRIVFLVIELCGTRWARSVSNLG